MRQSDPALKKKVIYTVGYVPAKETHTHWLTHSSVVAEMSVWSSAQFQPFSYLRQQIWLLLWSAHSVLWHCCNDVVAASKCLQNKEMTDSAFQPKVRNSFREYHNSRPVTYKLLPFLRVPGHVEQIDKGEPKYDTLQVISWQKLSSFLCHKTKYKKIT